ncbi:hypothetical protein GTCCBUS3UF5_12900 [Geobacillus thermoleovorans CCB_US3_UF5]|uniref:Uncharacterized protein n=2 Tax=Geobacillus thermoleovorans group TaxID=1505648 RepID=U2X6V8_GEOKU|nr:hypothetical protein GTCCBUS3UF5_12900 [Geobacillus thermoleovorans CCB_US3_UF5]GAD14527.1 hypothetical protein GBL_2744 [Geobacillus kaustophilus GBlys]GAJ59574.1 hypothetical protein B23_2799 [Geobacillus thermoleovorans B23]
MADIERQAVRKEDSLFDCLQKINAVRLGGSFFRREAGN